MLFCYVLCVGRSCAMGIEKLFISLSLSLSLKHTHIQTRTYTHTPHTHTHMKNSWVLKKDRFLKKAKTSKENARFISRLFLRQTLFHVLIPTFWTSVWFIRTAAVK